SPWPGPRGFGGQPGAAAPHRPSSGRPPGSPPETPAAPPVSDRATSLRLPVLPFLMLLAGLMTLLGPAVVRSAGSGPAPLRPAPLRPALLRPAPLLAVLARPAPLRPEPFRPPGGGSAPAGARVRPGSSWAQTAWRVDFQPVRRPARSGELANAATRI